MTIKADKPKPEEIFLKVNHQINVLLHASFMSGLLGNNPNSLTEDEIYAKSKAGDPHSWAYQIIAAGKDSSA